MKVLDRKDKILDRNFLVFCTVLIIIGTILVAGCTSQSQSQSAGSTTVQTPSTITDIKEILENSQQYNGTSVSVKGKITNECGSGCWFMLEDGTGLIYVDLAPNNFAIPQLQGSTVIVKGVIHVVKGDPTLTAASVATGTRTYP